MSLETLYQMLWLFFAYSFLGWMLETTAVLSKKKVCQQRYSKWPSLQYLHGVAALMISIALRELVNSWVFLF